MKISKIVLGLYFLVISSVGIAGHEKVEVITSENDPYEHEIQELLELTEKEPPGSSGYLEGQTKTVAGRLFIFDGNEWIKYIGDDLH